MLRATKNNLMKVRPGDKIKFSAVTRCGASSAVRKVWFVEHNGVRVSFHGWMKDFLVRWEEITHVEEVKLPTLTALKQANSVYFQRGKDKFHGVVERKILNTRTAGGRFIMVEEIVEPEMGYKGYNVRTIAPDTLKIGKVKMLKTITERDSHINELIELGE